MRQRMRGITSQDRPEMPCFRAGEFPVHLHTVEEVIARVAAYQPPREMRRMTESLLGWRAHYEAFLELAAETREEGWPFQTYPSGWSERTRQALRAFQQALDKEDYACHFPERSSSNLRQLSQALEIATRDPSTLQGRQVGMLRRILIDTEARWGALGSARRAAARRMDESHDFERGRSLLLERLKSLDPQYGIEDIDAFLNPDPVPIPAPLAQRVRLAWHARPGELLRHGVIDNPNALRKVALPWAQQALEKGEPREALRSMTATAWTWFPQAEALDSTVCNRLLRASASPVQLEVDSSDAALELALITSRASRDRLYGRYYQIPALPPDTTLEQLENHCDERARGPELDKEPHRLQLAEQRRILTSAGLWPLWRELQPEIDPLMCAGGVYKAIIGELRAEPTRRYRSLQQSRRIAWMWQRMVFFLSLASEDDLAHFVEQRRETCPPTLRKALTELTSACPSPVLGWRS